MLQFPASADKQSSKPCSRQQNVKRLQNIIWMLYFISLKATQVIDTLRRSDQ